MSADPGPRPEHFDPRRPPAAELATTVRDGFTLTAVGDCIISLPITSRRESEPRVAALLDLFARSDAVYGNMETVAVDLRAAGAAPYAWAGDWPLACTPEAAADLAVIGLGLLSRANNHALDWGIEGMRETSRHLDAAGITHAGCGESLALARAARFRETPGGRVALVSCTTSYRETTDGLDACGAAPGRPGVSALPLRRTLVVPGAVADHLAAARDELAAAGVAGALPAFEPAAEGTAGYRYEMDRAHLAEILRQVRQGKQFADVLVFAVHTHETVTSPDRGSPGWEPELPGAFVLELGREAIDAGADAVLVTGVHHAGPVAIHAGRPILAGLGNFIWSDVQTPLPGDLLRGAAERTARAFAHPERATDADVTLLLNVPYHANPETFLGLAAELEYGRGGLRRLTLHVVDMGYGDTLSRSGVPRLAGPEAATRVLDRMRSISAPHGTAIALRRDGERGTVVGEVLLDG